MDNTPESPDLAAILQDRPERIRLVFPEVGRVTLLCPPDGSPEQYEALRIAFGPLSGSILMGALGVGLPSRLDELNDLWGVIMREVFPTEAERDTGGEPLASVRTATLGWRLLAALGSAVETLATTSNAVFEWREEGQPTGPRCSLGESLLKFRTTGAPFISASLFRFTEAQSAAQLVGYPTEDILVRHVSRRDAGLLSRRCNRSADLVAQAFRVAAAVVQDPFWRTFVKWKHGVSVTSPGVAPMWLPQTPELDIGRTEARLNTGIVVFDLQREPAVYVWPAERKDFVLYSALAQQFLVIAQLILGSVLAYGRVGVEALQWFEIDEEHALSGAETRARDRLTRSPFPTAALAGHWRASSSGPRCPVS